MNRVIYEFNALTINVLDDVIEELSSVATISVLTRSEQYALIEIRDEQGFSGEELLLIGTIIGQIITKQSIKKFGL